MRSFKIIIILVTAENRDELFERRNNGIKKSGANK
jgi:hypothetical protein